MLLYLLLALCASSATGQLYFPSISSLSGNLVIGTETLTVQQAYATGNQLGPNTDDRSAAQQTSPVLLVMAGGVTHNCFISDTCNTQDNDFSLSLDNTLFPQTSISCLNTTSVYGYCNTEYNGQHQPLTSGLGGVASTCTRDADCENTDTPYCRTVMDTQNTFRVYWYNKYLDALAVAAGAPSYNPYIKMCVAEPITCTSNSQCPTNHQCVGWFTTQAATQLLYSATDCQLIPVNAQYPTECVDSQQCLNQPGTMCISNPHIDCSYNLQNGNCKYSMLDSKPYIDFNFGVTPSGPGILPSGCTTHLYQEGLCHSDTFSSFNGALQYPDPYRNGTWRASCQCGPTASQIGIVIDSYPTAALTSAAEIYPLIYSLNKGYLTAIPAEYTSSLLTDSSHAYWDNQLGSYNSRSCSVGYSCYANTTIGSYTASRCIGYNINGFQDPSCQYMGKATTNTDTGDWTCSCNSAGVIGEYNVVLSGQYIDNTRAYGKQQCEDMCEATVCYAHGMCTYGIDAYPGFSTDLTQPSAVDRSYPCDCGNTGWTGRYCERPDYDTGCCGPNGVYGYTPAACNNAPYTCPLFSITVGDCPYSIPPNATHPALCWDGSRPTNSITCYGLNDDASLANPSLHCSCYPGYFGPRCELSQSDCDETVCMGNGHCQLDPVANDIQCVCDPGWATYPPYNPGKAYKWSVAANAANSLSNNYQCQYPAPVALVDKISGLTITDTLTLSALPCGPYGSPMFDSNGFPIYYADGFNISSTSFSWSTSGRNYLNYESGFTGACQCEGLDNYGSFDNFTSYCVKQPSVWKSVALNDTSNVLAGFDQPCGAPYRGQVISLADGYGSNDCYCYNGFGGYDCSVIQCPANAYGDPCSGPGLLNMSSSPPTIIGRGWCDSSTSRCLCSATTIGMACEIDVKTCDNQFGFQGQTIA